MSRTDPSPARLAGPVRRCLLGTLPALLLGLGACRADSLITPAVPECTGAECGAPPAQPATAEVRGSLSDASERVLSGVTNESSTRELAPALRALEADLAAERPMQARMRLAEVYDLLDRMQHDASGALAADAPELDAIRLSLVPTAQALGVNVQ